MVLASLPSLVDVDFTKTMSVLLAILGVCGIVAVLVTVRSLATKVVAVIVLGASVFGLLHYRVELDRCDRDGCACKLFGQELNGGDRCNTAS